MAATYVVTAAAVVAKTSSDTGEGYFYRDSILPKGVLVAECKRLEGLGLVAEIAEAQPDPPRLEVPALPVATAKK